MKYLALLLTAPLAVSFFPLAAAAQAADTEDSNLVIEKVIVTATKREQSVQEVPIAVSAFTGEQLESRGIADVNQLQQISPSLMINTTNSSSNGGTIRIRGIGTIGNNVGLESAVGFFQDGAYRSRSGHALSDLFDIGRIEVLRGPQGTLFGKNTSAGAISVVSSAPEFEFGGNASVTAGNLDLRKYEGMLTGPIVADKLAFRIAATATKRDGDVREYTTNEDFNDRDRWAAKGQLLWTPTDNLTAKLIVDYAERTESCCAASFSEIGATGPVLQALGGVMRVSPDGRHVSVNRAPYEGIEDQGAVLDVEWDAGWATLTSVSTYREFTVDRRQDVDFTNVDLFQISGTDEVFETMSQELRLAGSTDSLDWLVGAYASSEDLSSVGQPLVTLGTQGPGFFAILLGNPAIAGLLQPGNGVSGSFKQDAESWALFTNNTWRFQDRWNLNVGLRYSEEEKAGSSLVNETGTDGVVDNNWPCAMLPIPTFCGNAGYSLERSEDRVTASVKLGYEVSDDMNLYAGWSNGYKAGGFNLDPLAYKFSNAGVLIGDGREFEEETVDSYEAGVKSEWLNGRLILNGALFYSKYEGFQVNTFTGTVFVVENVPEVVTQGVELEHNWLIAEGVNLQGGVTYTDARYTADTPIINATAAFGGPTNLEDMRLNNAPEWQSSFGVLVDRKLSFVDNWRYLVNANWMYRSAYNTGADLDPQKAQGAFSLFNAQVGVRTEDERLEAVLWVNNLFDEDYKQNVFDSVLQPGSWNQTVGDARLWGVTLRTRF